MASTIAPEQLQREAEVWLNNVALDSKSLSSRLRVWDDTAAAWRAMKTDEQPNARVLVINLWADYCKPCLEEFPVLRQMAHEVEGRHGGKVRFLFLSETNSPEAMSRFVAANRKNLPPRIYHDTSESVAEVLRDRLPSGNLPLPITLLVDERRWVRHAVVGVVQQRSALVEQINRLVAEPHRAP